MSNAVPFIIYLLCKMYEKNAKEVIRVVQYTKKNPLVYKNAAIGVSFSENAVSENAVTTFQHNDVIDLLTTFTQLAPSAFAKCEVNVINAFKLIENCVYSRSCSIDRDNYVAFLCDMLVKSTSNEYQFFQFVDIIPAGAQGFAWTSAYKERLAKDFTDVVSNPSFLNIDVSGIPDYQPSDAELGEFDKLVATIQRETRAKELANLINEFNANTLEVGKSALIKVKEHYSQIEPYWLKSMETTREYFAKKDIENLERVFNEVTKEWEKILENAKTIL